MHIGILGCGQLARMLAEAGRKLKNHFTFAAESEDAASPVAGFGNVIYTARGESAEQLYFRMGKPEVITVESENVSAQQLTDLAQFCQVLPSAKAVFICQNRKREKLFLNDLGLPTVNFTLGKTLSDIEQAVNALSYNVIIKSCEHGYDGKNQWRIKNAQDWQSFVENYTNEIDVVIEECVAFSDEVSLIAVRTQNGDTRFYPLSENRHQNGILLTTCAVTECALGQYENDARRYLQTIVDQLDYVGVMAMECFVVEGKLMINELAPRVHNSGHWTQQGCITSQFENHIRAITSMPIGDVDLLGPSAMLNLLGRGVNLEEVELPGATLYWYNKTCKPGRKVGHINLQDVTREKLLQKLNALERRIYAV